MSAEPPLTDSGARLAAALADRYRIERELGRGGMATVYVADDLRHDRKVAVKVLREDLSAMLGSERFLHEIRTTANLQHPHILPLHDSGSVDGAVYYVMPFVEGESLRSRIAREKQLPVAEAVRLAREVADALDYAHRRGVIHRDIKPENILLHEGRALVADFGIALAVSGARPGQRMTESGMSLGTPQYMSPEQAMGERDIDGRSDVYALGCVLYEMLAGEPPFTGPTAQAIVARILTEEPRPLSPQRRTIPPNVEAAVLVALAKLPADRFSTPAEFASALGDSSFTSGPFATAALRVTRHPARTKLRGRRSLLLGGAAVVALVAAVLAWSNRRPAPAGPIMRFTIVVPESLGAFLYIPGDNGPPAISPDGSTIAFAATRSDTTAVLVRHADRFQLEVVPGTARRPFFAPDGRSLAFLRGSSVWRVPVRGGEPVLVGEIRDASWNIKSHAWHPRGFILVAGSRGLWSIPETGGAGRLIYQVDSAAHEVVQHVSIAATGHIVAAISYPTSSTVAVLAPDGRRLGQFPEGIGTPAWAIDDVLIFTQDGQSSAARADFSRQRLVGQPVRLTGMPSGVPLAPSASLAWVDPSSSRRTLEPVWVTRSGEVTPTGLRPGMYRWPRLAPEGQRLAIGVGDTAIYVFDLRTGARSRLAADAGASEPVWLNSGRRIVFKRGNLPRAGLLEQAADASQPPDTLLASSFDAFPTSVAPGDSVVLMYGAGVEDPVDLFVVDRHTRAIRRLPLPAAQRGGRFSPDGRWIAYQSNDAGQMDIYVQPWPSLDARYVVSTQGGEEPVWSATGRELYYRDGDRIMMVRISSGPPFRASVPVQLFSGPYPRDTWGDQSYDVSADGRFLMLRIADGSPLQVFVVQNWFGEVVEQLRRR